MESTLLPPADSLFRPPAPAQAGPANPLLRPGPFFDKTDVCTLHLGSRLDASGLFGPSSQLQSVLSQLRDELSRLMPKPSLVVFPAPALPWDTDLAIDASTLALVRALAEHEISSGLTCRATLPRETVDQLSEFAEHVRINVPVLSADVTIQKALEPHAAILPDRLQTATELRQRGLQVQVCVEPIMPNLTDTRESFENLLTKVTKSGADSITAGYLFLRQGQKDLVEQTLEQHGWSEIVLSAFSEALVTRESGQPPITFLSKSRRQLGYALLMSVAAELGLEVRLGRTANPDFQPPKPPDAETSARFQAFIRNLRRRSVK